MGVHGDTVAEIIVLAAKKCRCEILHEKHSKSEVRLLSMFRTCSLKFIFDHVIIL